MRFRLATKADAAALLAIYKPYVENTAITFEYDLPSLSEFASRIEQIGSKFPYLVALENEKIIGYAYASPYRTRAAYDWVVELSIYLDENERQHGAGTQLYQKLLGLLTLLNYQRAYACITSPNPESIGFHQKFGFQQIGFFQNSGYKFGQWYGIVWLELPLQTKAEVQTPKPISALSSQKLTEILES